ncbi:MAG: DUF2190 family protein [Pseudomonadota bacterium]
MRNFIQPGHNVTVPAPAAVASGDGVLVGSMFGIANGDAENGADVVLSMVGVYTMPKTPANDIAVGAAVYWNSSAGEVTSTASGNTRIGVAIAAAGAGVTTIRVRLNGSF